MNEFAKLEALVTLTGDLETDLMQHVSYYYQVAIENARAAAMEDEAKYIMSNCEAQLQEAYRKQAEQNGEKITEERVKARIKTDTQYTQAYDIYLSAMRVKGGWNALMRAFDARGYVLNNLTALHGKGVSSDGVRRYDELRKDAAASRTAVSTRTPLKR